MELDEFMLTKTGKNAIGIDYKGKALLDITHDKKTNILQLIVHNENYKVVVEKVKEV